MIVVDLHVAHAILFFQFLLQDLHIILIEAISTFVVELAFAQIKFEIGNLLGILSDTGDTLGYAFAQQALVDTLVDALIWNIEHV